MASLTGTYTLGPDSATLTVRTGKRGAAAMAGHNLQIEVSSWSATLELAEDLAASKLSLTADSRSLQVIDGTGGAKPLGEDDKQSILQSIDEDVLKGGPISFESAKIHSAADHGGAEEDLHVHGNLNLLGNTGPIEFTLRLDEAGRLTGAATIVQSAFGIKPFSILFGTLKVADEVEVSVDGTLPAA